MIIGQNERPPRVIDSKFTEIHPRSAGRDGLHRDSVPSSTSATPSYFTAAAYAAQGPDIRFGEVLEHRKDGDYGSEVISLSSVTPAGS